MHKHKLLSALLLCVALIGLSGCASVSVYMEVPQDAAYRNMEAVPKRMHYDSAPVLVVTPVDQDEGYQVTEFGRAEGKRIAASLRGAGLQVIEFDAPKREPGKGLVWDAVAKMALQHGAKTIIVGVYEEKRGKTKVLYQVRDASNAKLLLQQAYSVPK